MIGHAMPAAGAAGLIKAALAVYHGVRPPTLHCEEPTPALAGTRFRTLATAEPWDAQTRRAAVNAFGFGGINAHVIVDADDSDTRVRAFAVEHAAHRAPSVRTRWASTKAAGFARIAAAAADAAALVAPADAAAPASLICAASTQAALPTRWKRGAAAAKAHGASR